MRDQAGAARDRRARERAPFPRRGDGRAAAVARQPGVGVRRRHPRRSDLPGDGVRRRPRPARGLEPLRRASHARSRSTSPSTSSRSCAAASPTRTRSRTSQLVHRDVSPGNVLLSFSGEVKLTDFGLATSTLKLEKTAPGIIYGKVSYLAPEQARREPLDGRADLYAAGILLWELLTGRQLFPLAAGRRRQRSPGDANSDALRARARSARRPAVGDLEPRAARAGSHRDAGAGAGARGSLPRRRSDARRSGRRSWRRPRPRPTPRGWPSSCGRCSPRTRCASGASATC